MTSTNTTYVRRHISIVIFPPFRTYTTVFFSIPARAWPYYIDQSLGGNRYVMCFVTRVFRHVENATILTTALYACVIHEKLPLNESFFFFMLSDKSVLLICRQVCFPNPICRIISFFAVSRRARFPAIPIVRYTETVIHHRNLSSLVPTELRFIFNH